MKCIHLCIFLVAAWNNGEYNLGVFNTGKKDQRIYMFNKLSDWTMEDWFLSDAWDILQTAPFIKWVLLKNIDEDDLERDDYAHVRTTLGKLTKRPEEEMQIWWDSLPQKSKNAIYSLPNFDAKVFKECVGIDVNKKS